MDVDCLMNFATPAWCAIDRNGSLGILIDGIETFTHKLAEPGPWWKSPFAGAFVGAGLAFLSNFFFLWLKERKEEKEKDKDKLRSLNAALAALTTDIDTLFRFKRDILIDYCKDVQLAVAAWEIGIEKIVKILPQLKELFKFHPKLTFSVSDYGDKLSFVASYRAGFLLTFHRVSQYLSAINDTVSHRNNYIEKLMDSEPEATTAREIQVNLQMLDAYAQSLQLEVNTALSYAEFSMEHLIEFADVHFGKGSAVEFDIGTDIPDLMPPKDSIADYRAVFEKLKAKEKSIQSSSFSRFRPFKK